MTRIFPVNDSMRKQMPTIESQLGWRARERSGLFRKAQKVAAPITRQTAIVDGYPIHWSPFMTRLMVYEFELTFFLRSITVF